MFAASKTSTPVAAGPTNDPYFNYVTALLHGDGTNGGQNNTFVDSSTNNFSITRNGDTTQGTIGPFNGGNYSNYFDGSGDFLSSSSTVLALGSGNFTVECWFYLTSTTVNQCFVDFRASSTATAGFFFGLNSTSQIQVFNNANIIAFSSSIVINTWYHIALVRSGTTMTVYLNGVNITTGTSSTNFTDSNFRAGSSVSAAQNLTGYMSNLRITKSAVYTANFTPSTLPLSTTSQTTLLTCASNRFEDLSGANNTITKNGDTQIQTFSPFVQSSSTPTSYSGFFDGNGDYVTTPANAAFQLTGDFTVEAWVYPTVMNNFNMIFGSESTGSPDYLAIRASFLEIQIAGSNYVTWTASFVAGQWYHVALTRSGTTLRAFVNGTQLTLSSGNTSQSGQFFQTGYGVSLARFYNASNPNYHTGSISNARIIKGTALYTANFTPPTTPLTAVSGTSLLTCQSSTFIDNSGNAFTITVNGNSQPIKGNPFGYTIAATTGYSVASNGGSAYFDGTGDSLTNTTNDVSCSGNFTLEFYVNKIASTGTDIFKFGSEATGRVSVGIDASNNLFYNIFGSSNVNLGTIPNVSWFHVALVRSGSTINAYINGTFTGTASNATTFGNTGGFTVGSNLNGYLSNLRLLRGTALYASAFVPPQAPLTAVTNTQLLLNMANASIIDNAEMNDYQTVGNAQISTSVKKYGTGSIAFDGNGDALYAPVTPSVLMGNGNFTVEAWVNPTTITSNNPIVESVVNLNVFSNSDIQYMMYLNVSGYAWFRVCIGTTNYQVAGATTAVPTGTWTHIAAVRNGANLTLYVNGINVSTIATLGTASLNGGNTTFLRAGASVQSSSYTWFNGYIDELRVTKGIARYTANFTPPTAAFPNY